MERIKYLINKLNEAQHMKGQRSIIEIDLMLDYTRVLYADLLEWRGRLMQQEPMPLPDMPDAPAPVAEKPQAPAPVATQPAAPTAPTPAPAQAPTAPVVPPSAPATAVEAAAPTQPTATQPQVTEQAAEAPAKEPLSESFPYSTRQQPVIPTPEPAAAPATAIPQPDLKQLVGLNDKFQFISELFRGNSAAFQEAIEHLNHQPNYNAAQQWVKDNLTFQYGWQEEDATVENFYSVLKRRFSVI